MNHYTNFLRKQGIKIVGVSKFITQDTYFDGTDYSVISIGDNVTTAREGMILTHDYFLTTAMHLLVNVSNAIVGKCVSLK